KHCNKMRFIKKVIKIATKALSSKKELLLATIDRFGVMTKKQIKHFISYTNKNLNNALFDLEDLKLINAYQFKNANVYYITKKGSRLIGLINFGYVKSENKNPYFPTLVHDLLVVDCVIQELSDIRQSLGDEVPLKIITERELLANKFLSIDFSQQTKKQIRRVKMIETKRIPDFLIEFPLEGEILTNAYEVELTRKSKQALMAKLNWLRQMQVQGNYNQVVYFFENYSVESFVTTSSHQLNMTIICKTIQ
ncbi:hypothetical protein, partial [Enterococcus sp. AZ103]|uniref:hypothetical protein n=1 Tax=Enterococcus sp. AZ103 TaxID=2774628 RepID=UPI003F24738B